MLLRAQKNKEKKRISIPGGRIQYSRWTTAYQFIARLEKPARGGRALIVHLTPTGNSLLLFIHYWQNWRGTLQDDLCPFFFTSFFFEKKFQTLHDLPRLIFVFCQLIIMCTVSQFFTALDHCTLCYKKKKTFIDRLYLAMYSCVVWDNLKFVLYVILVGVGGKCIQSWP